MSLFTRVVLFICYIYKRSSNDLGVAFHDRCFYCYKEENIVTPPPLKKENPIPTNKVKTRQNSEKCRMIPIARNDDPMRKTNIRRQGMQFMENNCLCNVLICYFFRPFYKYQETCGDENE